MKTLGIGKIDIEYILRDSPTKNEQTNFSLGPSPYGGGGYYGTISIKDF